MSESDTAPPLRANDYRDAWCGAVLPARVDDEVRVAGWVHRRRDHGGLVFIDLRDRTGIVQLVFDPDDAGDAFALGHELRPEHVISATGPVVRRSEETVNPSIPTGEVEVRVKSADLLASAQTPPFEIEGFSGEVSEETRLRHRYLDLRREQMRSGLELRDAVTREMRAFLHEEGFLDVETPVLTRSTPEGARDFLVPSRLQQGSFYALPQSPQLFKQLLMVGGLERYYQVARCFRDEDLRADRQPDFTQLDLEMSFVEMDDVIDLNERLLVRVLAAAGVEVEAPFPRIPYDEAIAKYGNDSPDTRFGLELSDLTEHLRDTEFKAFGGVISGGGVVWGINAGARDLPRAQLDGLVEDAQELGAKGLVWAVVENAGEGPGWRSPVAKFLSETEVSAINGTLGAAEGDLLLLVADEAKTAAAVLGALRERLAARWGLVPEGTQALSWIVDWPLVEWNDEEGRWDPLHHPFTRPAGELDPASPGETRALAYDVVWNGVEIGGGSIRIHDPELQQKAFGVLGITPEEAQNRFGFLLEALQFGAPPHGGIAYGLDRIVAILHGTDSIRDVIAFPKTASGTDALTAAPAPVDEQQLRELGLALRKAGPRKKGGG